MQAKTKLSNAQTRLYEMELQSITLEMVEAWRAREWGTQSTANFLKFIQWLDKELSKFPTLRSRKEKS